MTSTARRNRLALALGASALLGALVLSGCTPEPGPEPTTTSTPSPTPTLSTDPAPQNEEEAIAAAEDAIAEYLQVRGEVNASGGTDTEALVAVSTGPALQIALDSAARVVELGWKTEGALEFTPTTGYAVDLVGQDGASYPFSSVTVTGCQDSSNYKVFEADGSPAQQPEQQRNEIEFNVIWEPVEETWLVNNALATGATC